MPNDPTRRLVDVAWLRGQLADPSVVAVEVGTDDAAYHSGHVPGAVAMCWLDDLNEGHRRGVPSRSHVERLLGARGISRDSHVVLYGEQDNIFAAYAYWALRYYGHPRLSLLDGGRRAWLSSGAPVSDVPADPVPTHYLATPPDDSIRLTRDLVLGRYVGAPPTTALVDCRAEPEFRGRPCTATDLPLLRHRLGGHIPGARNLDSTDLVEGTTGRLRPLAELRQIFAAQRIDPDQDIALYCDVGGRSALAWFVLHELLGFPRVRVYDGGWAEYGSLVAAPVSR